MARILVDGFETGAFLSNWTLVGTACTVSSVQKKTGSYSARIYNGVSYITSPITLVGATIYFKFHLYFSSWADGDNMDLIRFFNAEGVQISIGFKTFGDRKLKVFRGGMTETLLATASTELGVNTWYLIEGKVTLHGTTGVVQIKVDGVCPGLFGLDFTGNTLRQATPSITSVQLFPSSGSAYATYYIDGFVLDDANWIGDSRIIGIVPNGAGATTQWTPSAGDNYACVDEVPAVDTDYVSVNANDQVDLYDHADLPAEVYTIKSVSVLARVVKEGVSTPQNVKLAINIDGDGSSPRLSSNQALSYSMLWKTNMWETNPVTGLAWTPAELNAAQFGIKSAA